MSGALYVGTSGFSYKEWKGDFYPEDLPNTKMLDYYSEHLPSVEVNYTFRRMPAESTLTKWKKQAAEGFRFTLKAPQRITHFKRLVDTGEDVEEFVRRARLLGDALGTILYQCPPSLAFEKEKLAGFLAVLPPVTRHAMEFRHPSFQEAEPQELLREHGVALCGADTEKTPVEEVPVTAPYAYLRLRKDEYADDELALWAKRVRGALDAGHDVYCYFKHEGGGIGPRYATFIKDNA
jgi:uncharacterized protein YecE (DUF72 family)